LNNLKIGTRLGACFAILVALMLAVAAMSVARLHTMSGTIAEANTIRQQKLGPLYDIREALDQTGIAARNAFIQTDDAAAARELAELDRQRDVYVQRLGGLESALAGRADFANVRDELRQMAKELDRPRKYREGHDMAGYSAFLINECSPLRRKIVADLGVVIGAIETDMGKASDEVTAATAQSTWIVAGISALALVLSAVLAVRVTAGVVQPIRQACAFAEAVERGDLTASLETRSGDELGMLMRTLHAMRQGLSGIVLEVRTGASAISTVTEEIAAGNEDLSRRTESQASSLEQTAASMETLTETVRRNADTAQVAGRAAESATSVASQGGAVMQEVIAKMATIDGAAARIVDIIAVIDGIAFQTNILALNAAVEAARAGEQGRGFAVVASEVRTLAQRSGAAAQEIKGLIEESVEAIGAGSHLVQQAGGTMERIVEHVTRLSSTMREIVAASDDQALQVGEINRAVGHVDGLTQQNAALVEQASAAAQALHEQSVRLAEQVGKFRTESRGRARASEPMLALS